MDEGVFLIKEQNNLASKEDGEKSGQINKVNTLRFPDSSTIKARISILSCQ